MQLVNKDEKANKTRKKEKKKKTVTRQEDKRRQAKTKYKQTIMNLHPPLTLTQMKVSAILPKVCCIFSFFGCFYIIQHVLRCQKRRRHSIYHRLLLGMSLQDVIFSIGTFVSTWAVPTQESQASSTIWTYGTMGTCVAQGFVTHAGGLTSILYNASLTLFVVLTVKYNWQQEQIRNTRLELWLHFIPILLGYGTAIACIPLKLFNPIGFQCWIGPGEPLDCTESFKLHSMQNQNQHEEEDEEETASSSIVPCVRGDNYTLYRWFFFHGWLWFAFVASGVGLIMVYITVRKQEQIIAKYTFGNSGTGNEEHEYECDGRTRDFHYSQHGRHAVEEYEGERIGGGIKLQENEKPTCGNAMNDGEGGGGSTSRSSSMSDTISNDLFQPPLPLPTAAAQSTEVEEASTIMAKTTTATPPATTRSTRRRRREEENDCSNNYSCYTYSSRLARQGYFFFIVWFLVWIASTIHWIVHSFTGTIYVPLLLIMSGSPPSQGFADFLVYIRPMYVNYRNQQLHKQQQQQQEQKSLDQQLDNTNHATNNNSNKRNTTFFQIVSYGFFNIRQNDGFWGGWDTTTCSSSGSNNNNNNNNVVQK